MAQQQQLQQQMDRIRANLQQTNDERLLEGLLDLTNAAVERTPIFPSLALVPPLHLYAPPMSPF